MLPAFPDSSSLKPTFTIWPPDRMQADALSYNLPANQSGSPTSFFYHDWETVPNNIYLDQAQGLEPV